MGSFTSNSSDETFELGRQWAADVSAGWVIGLMGDLGTLLLYKLMESCIMR